MTAFAANSWYDIATGSHKVRIGRYEMRERGIAHLVWSWKVLAPGEEPGAECFQSMDEFELKAFFQGCLDKAWSMGLRPEHYQQDSKELQAVRGHLEDMRTLVFKSEKP